MIERGDGSEGGDGEEPPSPPLPLRGEGGQAPEGKLTMRKAYGFRSYDVIELALYHALRNLPEPKFTHKFC